MSKSGSRSGKSTATDSEVDPATTDMPASPGRTTKKFWVEPESLPDSRSTEGIEGNASQAVKQICVNVFDAYGVGNEDCFAESVGKKVWFSRVDIINKKKDGEGDAGTTDSGIQAITVADVIVDKGMLNGNGMLHGGCIAYLVDNCCSSPLVVLGAVTNKNGVGVTQSINLLYHSPVSSGTHLQIISTSLALGGRSMTARCEVSALLRFFC